MGFLDKYTVMMKDFTRDCSANFTTHIFYNYAGPGFFVMPLPSLTYFGYLQTRLLTRRLTFSSPLSYFCIIFYLYSKIFRLYLLILTCHFFLLLPNNNNSKKILNDLCVFLCHLGTDYPINSQRIQAWLVYL